MAQWQHRVFVTLCIATLAGCQMPPLPKAKAPIEPKEEVTVFEGVAMVVPYRIVLGTSLEEKAKKQVQAIIDTTFKEIDAIYNRWNPNSEVSHLNQAKAKERLPVSVELETFLERTGKIVALTEGRFDPTIEPVLVLWKQALTQGKIPEKSEIDDLAPAIGWHHIHLDHGVFWKDDDRTALDLGGVAKGFAIDLLVDNLLQAGHKSIYVDWGGDLKAAGCHPDGRQWHIAISGPTRPGEGPAPNLIESIFLLDQAIATSGDYLQYWTVPNPNYPGDPNAPQKVTYSHVINPKTLDPLQVTTTSVASASVMARDCMFADGIATALMVFSSEQEASMWAENLELRLPQVQCWVFARPISGEGAALPNPSRQRGDTPFQTQSD